MINHSHMLITSSANINRSDFQTSVSTRRLAISFPFHKRTCIFRVYVKIRAYVSISSILIQCLFFVRCLTSSVCALTKPMHLASSTINRIAIIRLNIIIYHLSHKGSCIFRARTKSKSRRFLHGSRFSPNDVICHLGYTINNTCHF